MSLNLHQGKLIFRFDLGGGMVSMQSQETVSLNEWHVAKLNRDERQASLQLDEGKIVRGMALGALTELNLELPLYLGGFR